MIHTNKYDAIIIGGSYAGLSAAMTLGRSIRNILVIDSGNPCNMQTPHSHNFITQDGETPAEIARKAKEQVEKYDTIHFIQDEVIDVRGENRNFEVNTKSGKTIQAEKILFATGVRDEMPSIKGFLECWGISLIHCPYCHGYEYKFEKTGILSNGAMAFEYAKLINNWTKELVIFTNGKSELNAEISIQLKNKNIEVIESEITEIIHEQGHIKSVIFKDGSSYELHALYHRPLFKQHCQIPEKMGCEMTENGHISVNSFNQTSIAGVYAAGDNTSQMRSVANAVSTGNVAGAVINKELIDERFYSEF